MTRPILSGIFAGFGLLAIYFVTMTALSKSVAVTWEQFKGLWYLMLPLAVTFGVQVSLYTKIRAGRKSIAAGGSSGALAMLACCAHHATDVLPIVGLSAVSLFLSRYQVPILVGSLVINVIGVAIMYRNLRIAT